MDWTVLKTLLLKRAKLEGDAISQQSTTNIGASVRIMSTVAELHMHTKTAHDASGSSLNSW